MEKQQNEATELAGLAGSADSEAACRPTSSFSEAAAAATATQQQQQQEPHSPVTGSATSGYPDTLHQDFHQDLNNESAASISDDVVSTAPLVKSASVSDDYLQFLSRPHHIEKRFPVDRKKLEQLIIEGGHDNETAGDFFKRVQETTDTLILWPSRLKIGAKSKKDPQVKVVGLPANIQRARELILTDLDAKSTRVTLKMEIAFSEHSHVIGKEGINIKKVHSDTKCHIHFPDSNRSSSRRGEKSNQVSITGLADNVELARRKIRELLPAVVTFVLPLPSQVEVNTADLEYMMLQYNVIIHLKPQPRQYSLQVVVRGTIRFLDGVKLAVSNLVEYFTGDPHLVPIVNLNLDIASQHHQTLIGSGCGNISKIMADTSTSIQFPDPMSSSRYNSNHVAVTGTVDSVFRAREQLLGCLPVVLMFDVHESDEIVLSSSLIGDLMQQLDLYISVKPKKGQLQSIIIKSIEQNILCMYTARNRLLEFSYQPIITSSPPPTHHTHSPVPAATRPIVSPPPQLVSSSPTHTPPPAAPASSTPRQPPLPLKEAPSKVTFSSQPTVIKDTSGKTPATPEALERRVSFKMEKEGPTTPEALERRVSFKMEKEDPVTPEALERRVSFKMEEETAVTPEALERRSPVGGGTTPNNKDLESSPPSEMRARSSSSSMGQRPSATPPVRLTTKQFIDYDRKREQAQIAMKSKVVPNELRSPTPKWAGYNFSESMPADPKRGEGDYKKVPLSPSSTPQGLTSINRTGYQALVRQASQERVQSLQSEQDLYRGITDLPTLLQRLNLDHYQGCFEKEEVDLTVFLAMTEADLKEVGVTTLGARRKLQIASSELKKQQGKIPAAALPRSSASLGRSPYRSTTGSIVMGTKGASTVGINRSGSLTREPKFSGMSRSGRF